MNEQFCKFPFPCSVPVFLEFQLPSLVYRSHAFNIVIVQFPTILVVNYWKYTGDYTSTVAPSRWGFVFLPSANSHLLSLQPMYVVVGLYNDRCFKMAWKFPRTLQFITILYNLLRILTKNLLLVNLMIVKSNNCISAW